jgi:hypothetical protein
MQNVSNCTCTMKFGLCIGSGLELTVRSMNSVMIWVVKRPLYLLSLRFQVLLPVLIYAFLWSYPNSQGSINQKNIYVPV